MDTRLVERARDGDRDAFQALAETVVDRLYSTAILIVHDSALAEDASQEALIRAWRGLPRLRDSSRFDAWLNRILLNACLDSVKSRRGGANLSAAQGAIADGLTFEVDYDRRDEVSRALARLRPAERAVLVLRYFVGLSTPQLAEALAVPLGTAKSRLHNALRAMRAAVEADRRVALQGGLA